jgi:uncharacterized protein YjbI with pentapeptide repeats
VFGFRSNLRKAEIRFCDLSNAKFIKAMLADAKFFSVNINGVDFSGLIFFFFFLPSLFLFIPLFVDACILVFYFGTIFVSYCESLLLSYDVSFSFHNMVID